MSKVQLAGNASGTGIFTIASPNSNTDRTQTLPDASGTLLNTGSTAVITQAMLAPNIAGNGPAFFVSPNADTTISSASDVVIENGIETFDTGSRFNNTGSTVGGIPAYAFLPNVAGYYFFTSTINTELSTGPSRFINSVRLNGTTAYRVVDTSVAYAPAVSSGSFLIYLNGTSDYVQQVIYLAATTPRYSANVTTSRFSGFLVRAA
jgi:hypothetical protein